MEQALEIVLERDEHAEVGDLGDLALEVGAHEVSVGDVVLPRVLGELLHAESHALLLLVDGEDDRLDDVALLDHLLRVADLACPRHVADVQQTIDAFLDLDEGAVVGEVAHPATNDRADRVLVLDQVPRVVLDLLHAEGDLLLLRVDVEDDDVDHVTRVHHLVRMVDAARPRHLGDVHETLDALFELHEGAVGHHVHDLALDLHARLVAVLDALPRRRRLLLEAESDALRVLVELEHLDLDRVVDVEHLAGVVDATPGHVGDVEQAVDAAEVHERAEVSDVLDHATTDLTLRETTEDLLLLLLAALFEELAARDDDVHARLVDLDDPRLDFLADVVADVASTTNLDLRGRQEHRDADVDEESALDLANDLALDHVALGVSGDDALPPADAIGATLGELEHPLVVVHPFEIDLDVGALFGHRLTPLFDRDQALGLVLDVDEDRVRVHLDDATLHDRVGFE